MQPAPENAPEAEVETTTHHQVRTIHTPMPHVNVLCYLLLTSGWVLIRMYVQNTNHPKPPTPQRSGKSKKSKSKNLPAAEEADMQPAPEKEPEAEVETATHHQVRTIHTPMPPPVQSKARMHAALAMSMYYATCC